MTNIGNTYGDNYYYPQKPQTEQPTEDKTPDEVGLENMAASLERTMKQCKTCGDVASTFSLLAMMKSKQIGAKIDSMREQVERTDFKA